jgi:peptidoglycan/LPS O-acetylase OafA/YrhL
MQCCGPQLTLPAVKRGNPSWGKQLAIPRPNLPKLGLFAGPSLQDHLAASSSRPSGFDYMRLILALSVISWHTFEISYGPSVENQIWNSPWRLLIGLILPMFFALSGFLVAGSLERSQTLLTFFMLRFLRIVPALAGEVTLSALVLGPLVTVDPLNAYFSDKEFWAYGANIVGDIHYHLPGAFLNNPLPETVNGQLWTVPFELYCYVLVAVLGILGVFARRLWLLLFLTGFYAVEVANTILRPRSGVQLSGWTLVMTFVAGLLIFRYRDRIAWNRWIFCLSGAASLALLYWPGGDRFVAIPAAYATVWLGLLNPPRSSFFLSGDYSYGLFLYGYPLQQAIASISPAVQHWYWNLIIAVPCAATMAILSWWFVEKPALGLRAHLKQLDRWYLLTRQAVLPRPTRDFP